MRREAIKTCLTIFFPTTIATIISNYDSHFTGNVCSFDVMLKDEEQEPGFETYNPIHSMITLHDGRIAIGRNGICEIFNPSTSLCEITRCELAGFTYANPLSEIVFTDFEGSATCLAELNDGRIVVCSGNWVCKLQIWNVKTGKCDVILDNNNMFVSKIVVLHDQRIMAFGSDITNRSSILFKIWNLNDIHKPEIVTNIITKQLSVYSCIYLDKNGQSLIVTNHHTLALWNPVTKYFNMISKKKSDYLFFHAIILSNGNIVSLRLDKLILSTIINQKKINNKEYLNKNDIAFHLMIELADERLALLNCKNQLKIFDMKTNQFDLIIDLPKGFINNMGILPNGDVVCTTQEGRIFVCK
jgi:WD40 repeat protein